MYKVIIALSLATMLASCDGCQESQSTTMDISVVTEVERAIAADPSRDNVETQLGTLRKEIAETHEPAARRALMTSAYEIARAQDNSVQAVSFLMPLIRENPKAEENRDYIYYIGESMIKTANRSTGELILQGFIESYPNDSRVEVAKAMIQNPELDKDAYIRRVAESVFENPDQYGINRANAQKYVDLCEAHGLVYPNDAMTPEYLYRAGEIAVAIRTFPKSLSIYDWLVDFYPDYDKSPNALFAKGYLLDEEIKKPERAKAAYQRFLETYPTHELADDAQFLLQNIGKSGEEIIKIIEANKKKQENSQS